MQYAYIGKGDKRRMPCESTPLRSYLTHPSLLQVTPFPTWIPWELLPAFSKWDVWGETLRFMRQRCSQWPRVYIKQKNSLVIYTSSGTDSSFLIGHGVPGIVVWPCCGRIPSIGITSGILPFHFNSVEMSKVDMIWFDMIWHPGKLLLQKWELCTAREWCCW